MQDWLKAPVAVLGWGVSGKAAAGLIERLGGSTVAYDEQGSEAQKNFAEKEAAQHRLVVFSPGFPVEHPWLETAREAGCAVLGELEFGALCWPGAIVAVTGTNGKTTLTDFLAQALINNGGSAIAAGNIGVPMCAIYNDTFTEESICVLELSSFQAESLQRLRLQGLLWTNFAEDHLDRHGTLERYFKAKWKIVEHLCRDCLIVGSSVVEWAARFGITPPAHTAVVSMEDAPLLVPQGCVFTHPPQQENYMLARHFWEREGFPLEILEETARKYPLLKHRLREIAEVGAVTYWNDSKATNPHAAIAALESFDTPLVWIGGGRDKGLPIDTLAEKVAGKVRVAILLGDGIEALAPLLEKNGVKTLPARDMAEAVQLASENARAGEAVLLSPGYASFGLFKDYAERGNLFEKAVFQLKETPKTDTP